MAKPTNPIKSSQSASPRGITVLLLALCLCVAMGRLLFFAVRFARQSLQMDFAAYYVAGQAVDRGLTPYENQVDATPPLWDGVARYTHSRFLYPPLAAYLFVPLARLPYLPAKSLWTILNLLCVGAGLAVTAWAVGFDRITRPAWLAIGIGTALYRPLLTHLERGQIDCLTLVLLTLSIALMTKRGAWSQKAGVIGDVGAGLLLAFATLLKLHVGLIVPFLLLRRRFVTSGAYAAGLGLIVTISLLVAPALSIDYVTHQLPRISTYGEGGTEEMLLDPASLARLLNGVPEGMTRLASAIPGDNRLYLREYFSFFPNGTMVREVAPRVQQLGLSLSISQLSIGLFLLYLGAFSFWLWLNRGTYRQRIAPATAEFIYWALALIVILLTAPATWVMNLVWLLPLFVILASEVHKTSTSTPVHLFAALLLVVWLAALLLAAAPGRPIGLGRAITARLPEWLLYPWGWEWANRKYLLAQNLLLVTVAAYVTVTFGAQRPVRGGESGPRNAKSAA